jgi:hypothetical protein
LFADSIEVKEGADISADRVLMYAKESVKVNSGAVIRSTIDNECTTDGVGNRDLYECMDLEFEKNKMDEAYVLRQYNQQYKLTSSNRLYAKVPLDMQAKILTKWNVYLMSLGELNLNLAEVTGPRVGLCANNLFL